MVKTEEEENYVKKIKLGGGFYFASVKCMIPIRNPSKLSNGHWIHKCRAQKAEADLEQRSLSQIYCDN